MKTKLLISKNNITNILGLIIWICSTYIIFTIEKRTIAEVGFYLLFVFLGGKLIWTDNRKLKLFFEKGGEQILQLINKIIQ